ncbi:MAG: aldolase [Chloroflexi bacterium]|nr:aldolase [Chloroflexota bacterium]
MIENKVKHLLKAGGTAIGTMVTDTRTPAVAVVLANAGFDYFILDTEHGPYSMETVADLMLMARLAGIAPFVRVADDHYPWIARTLDAGALGIMVPRVKTRAQVEAIVQCAKYPPLGERGMAAGRGNTQYRGMKLAEYAPRANEEIFLILQIETQEAVEQIDDLLSVPGVDAALMGPNDLSMALGVPGDGEHPKLTEAVQKVVDSAARHGIPSGTHVRDMQNLKGWRDKGMRLLMYSSDFGFIAGAGAAAVKELRSA